MQKIDILGHCTSGLPIAIDILYEIYKYEDIIINIVAACNMDFHDRTLNIPYKINNITTKECNIETWKPTPYTKKIIATTDNYRRREIFNNLQKSFNMNVNNFSNLIHPLSYIAFSIKMGYGNIISPLVSLAPFSKLGNFNFINRNSNIGHHTIIEDFCFIAPGCNIAGMNKIHNNVTIGIGATIIENINIGENSIIGAGSVVTKNVPPNSVYYGVPAKFIRSIEKKDGDQI